VSIVVLYNLARTSKLTQPVVSRSGNYRQLSAAACLFYSTTYVAERRLGNWHAAADNEPSRLSLTSDVRKRRFWQRCLHRWFSSGKRCI